MRKLLLVSGCSFTTDYYISRQHPQLDATWKKWPEILADELNMELLNLGKSGSGNEYIFNSLAEQIVDGKREIGLAIAAWSQAQRRDWMIRTRLNPKWSSSHLDMKGDVLYFLNKSLRYFYLFELLCKTNNIPYKHFSMIPLIEDFINEQETRKISSLKFTPKEVADYISTNAFYNNMDKEHFIGWPITEYLGGASLQKHVTNLHHPVSLKISREDPHPNAKGHEMYAKFIKENL